MDPMAWFKAYLGEHAPAEAWSAETDWAVRLCIRAYRNGGAAELKRYVLDCAEAPAAAGCWRALFFALEETGETRIREAIESVMAELGRTPSEAPMDAQTLYAELPFRMAYEMKLGGMEKVGLVAAAFRRAYQASWDADHGLFGGDARDTALVLLALTDAIRTCSDQLYEHWRAMVDIYRAMLRGALASDAAMDAQTTAMLVSALLDGVRQGLIDPERYLPVARRRMSALQAEGQDGMVAMLEMEGGADGWLK